MWELSKEFLFDAAHTLSRDIETESSKRIHGHSYRAVVTIAGTPASSTGMIADLGEINQKIQEVRHRLDHHFLDEVAGLGPATIENLSKWIWDELSPVLPGLRFVTVSRDSHGDSCKYCGDDR